MTEITAVAEACLAAATRAVVPEGLAVVALGKLGGAELNYASDVDVVFVHEGSGPERQEAAERASAALVRTLADPTAEGIALRVDTTLRPGGARGALSWSLDAMRGYYETQAATWERQALIKARPVAGDPELGSAFVHTVAPFVFPEVLPESTIDEVRRVKVRLEEYVRAAGKADVEVKRGRGGIRDVEFAVQLLQIVHGRRDERLREPNTLRALEVLADEGYVGRDDAAAFGHAYRFLRTLEHRLQIVRDLQTHELPADPSARTVLARSLGMQRRGGAARRVRTPDHAGPPGPRAALLPAVARVVRGALDASARPGPGGDGRAAGGARVRRAGGRVRGAHAARRAVHAHGQGPGARVPRHGAGARARVRARCGADPARAGGRGDGR